MSETVTIDGLPPHVSWSSFDQYLSCPKRWQLGRLVRVEQRPMWAGVGGSAVHKATELYDLRIFSNRVIDNDASEGHTGAIVNNEGDNG